MDNRDLREKSKEKKEINFEEIKVDESFNIIFNKNSLNSLNKINFLAENYRPKCDYCKNLCGLDWFMERENSNKNPFLICDMCFDTEKFEEIKNFAFERKLQKKDFERANFFNIIAKGESRELLN